jgi:hypothetical protein
MNDMPPRFFSWIVFYLFLAVLIAAAIALFWPGRGLLLPYLTPKPELFTELYFENHLELPKKVVVGLPYEFRFTIKNHQGRNINYPIEVTAYADEQATGSAIATISALPLFAESVVVSDSQAKTIPVTYTLPEGLGERVKVEVNLTNLQQHIFFWVYPISTQSAAAQGIPFVVSPPPSTASTSATSASQILFAQ